MWVQVPLLVFKSLAGLAQLGEHPPYKGKVTGSSPVSRITMFIVMVREAINFNKHTNYWLAILTTYGTSPIKPEDGATERNFSHQ